MFLEPSVSAFLGSSVLGIPIASVFGINLVIWDSLDPKNSTVLGNNPTPIAKYAGELELRNHDGISSIKKSLYLLYY